MYMKYLLILFSFSVHSYDVDRLNAEKNFAFEEMKKKKLSTGTNKKRLRRSRLGEELPIDDKIYDLDKTFDTLGTVSKSQKRKFKRTRKVSN